MMQNFSSSTSIHQQTVKAMDAEQFEQVVKAIVEGKYSWACVLILRFAGYNPAHYIPYRTYKRLIKENRRAKTIEQGKPTEIAGDIDGTRTEARISSAQKATLGASSE